MPTSIILAQTSAFTVNSSPDDSKLSMGRGASLERPGTVESLQVFVEVQSPLCDTAPKALVANMREIKVGKLCIFI